MHEIISQKYPWRTSAFVCTEILGLLDASRLLQLRTSTADYRGGKNGDSKHALKVKRKDPKTIRNRSRRFRRRTFRKNDFSQWNKWSPTRKKIVAGPFVAVLIMRQHLSPYRALEKSSRELNIDFNDM